MKKTTWEDVPRALFPRFLSAVHGPGVALAEAVGRFEPPFEYLKAAQGGFDDRTRFILNHVIIGDADAREVRDWRMAMMRSWRLDEPSNTHEDWERKYLEAHLTEYEAYRRHHFPWLFSFESAGVDQRRPDPK